MPGSLVLYNGRIHPLTGIVHCVEAISILEGHVHRLGTSSRVRENIPPSTPEIDLHGRTVLPSFSDNLGCLGREIAARARLDLSATQSMPEIFAVIEQATRKVGTSGWISGYGWNKSQWGWQRFPHRADLDLVSPHHPVALLSSDGRVAWLNSAGLAKAGIRRNTPNPTGGEIERDPITGAATGILLEGAVTFIRDALQKPALEEAVQPFTEIVRYYHSIGVTSVHTFEAVEDFELIRALAASQAYPLDITCHLNWPDCESIAIQDWKSGKEIDGLVLGGAWKAVDGTLSSQTALMVDPYVADWDKHGIEITPPAELRRMTEWCLEHLISPMLLASGDAACHQASKVLSQVYQAKGGPHPFIIHGDLIGDDDLDRLRRLGLGLLTDPRRIDSDKETGRTCWGKRWDRALDLVAWKERGVSLHFGSSKPIRHWNPIKSLSSALLVRAGKGRCAPLDVIEGLLSLSRPLTYQRNEEMGAGLLSPGQFANLVVMSGDPFQVTPQEVASIQVEMTVRRGEVVYTRNVDG